MISTKEAIKVLEDSGLTPVIMQDEKDNSVDHVFIKSDVVWAKLISAIRQYKRFNEALNSIPHVHWLENLLIKHNPELEAIRVGKQVGYGIKFEAIVNKRGLVPHIDKCFHFYFFIVQQYIKPILDRFVK